MTAAALRHDALFYDSDASFLSALSPFVCDGVDAGEGVMVVTSRPRIEALRDDLGAKAADIAFVPAADWYVHPVTTIAAWAEALRTLRDRGHAVTRVVGEVQFGDGEESQRSWVRYESALNAVFADSDTWIVCPYDTRALGTDLIEAASRTHPAVWHGGDRRPSAEYVDPGRLLRDVPEPWPAPPGPPVLRAEFTDGLVGLRHDVRAAVGDALPPDRLEDALVVLTELVTNALRHGAPPALVTVWARPGEMIAEVADRDLAGLDPLAGYHPPPPESANGMGLWVARHLSNRLAVRTGAGTVVRAAVHG